MTTREFGILLAGIMIGVLPGFLIAQAMDKNANTQRVGVETASDTNGLKPTTPAAETIAVPETAAECAVLISRATTKNGADVMFIYCKKAFPDFLQKR